MTVESYQAWDGKKYKWPPPEGWYVASDKKWWPEGYGPKANAAGKDGSETSAVAKVAPAEKVDAVEKLDEDPELSFAESLKKYRSNHPEMDQEKKGDNGGEASQAVDSQTGTKIEIQPETTVAASDSQSEVVKNLTPVSHEQYLGKNKYLTNTSEQKAVTQKPGTEPLAGGYGLPSENVADQLASTPESASKPAETFQNMSGYTSAESADSQASISDLLLPPMVEKKKKKSPKFLKLLVFVLLIAAVAAGGYLVYSNYIVDDAEGSFAAPYERNSDPVVLQENAKASWIFQIGDTAQDVTAQVTDPKPGFVYLETPLEIWLEKGLPAAPVSELGIAVLDADKNSIARASNCNMELPLDLTAETSDADHAIGSLCWEVPLDKLDGLRLEMSVATSKGGVYRFIQD